MVKPNKTKKYEMNMCTGSLWGKILIFYLPLMLSGILQLLFNAADIAVVGRFSGNEALAAVGSTSSLTNLLVNLFIGMSVGTNVLVSMYYGSGQEKDLKQTVKTSILFSVFGGIALIIIGYFVSKPALMLMETPEDVIHHSVRYMRIYFCGMPFIMAYNFGSAILRAIGDTKRSLYYLSIAGVTNVILNLIFVIVFQMGVAGVALATVISQAISAILVIRCLIKSDGVYRLELNDLKIDKDKLLRMIRIGIPAGIQGSLFSISNVLIQSSINSFGAVVVAGNTAGSNIEGFVYVAMNSFYQAAISFSGQNYGAKEYKRVKSVFFICELYVIIVGLLMGNGVYLFADKLLKIYTSDMEVIQYGILRISYICIPYFLCGMMDVANGILRGMGYSLIPMFVSLTGACLFRVVWILTAFMHFRTLPCLYLSYPISWFLTFTVHSLCIIIIYRKLVKSK